MSDIYKSKYYVSFNHGKGAFYQEMDSSSFYGLLTMYQNQDISVRLFQKFNTVLAVYMVNRRIDIAGNTERCIYGYVLADDSKIEKKLHDFLTSNEIKSLFEDKTKLKKGV